MFEMAIVVILVVAFILLLRTVLPPNLPRVIALAAAMSLILLLALDNHGTFINIGKEGISYEANPLLKFIISRWGRFGATAVQFIVAVPILTLLVLKNATDVLIGLNIWLILVVIGHFTR